MMFLFLCQVGFVMYLHVNRNLQDMESIIYEFVILKVICFLYSCWGELWTPEKGAASWLRPVCANRRVFCVQILKHVLWWMSFLVRGWKKVSNTRFFAFCCRFSGSLPVLTRGRSWRALWTWLLCVAAMETPTPTSVPCVSRDSEYTQLLHSHSSHTLVQRCLKMTSWRIQCQSRPLVVNEFKDMSINEVWFPREVSWLAPFSL